MKNKRLADGRERLVRHGHGPERLVQTGIGAVAVQRVKLRDRGAEAGSDEAGAERICFTSAILPTWARRTRSPVTSGLVTIDVLLPVLHLRGISTGDFQEALAALLGKEAPNLSPAVIARRKASGRPTTSAGSGATSAFREARSPAARHDVYVYYVYVWADGVYLQARMEPPWSRRLNACWC